MMTSPSAAQPTRLSLWHELARPVWVVTSILVILAALVMVRLGFWQLDRLAQRKATNAQIMQAMTQSPLDLNGALPPDLSAMVYRQATVKGTYDTSQEVLWRNQVQDGQPGYHLLTPLLISGSSQAVLVDRGFIPLAEAGVEARKKYDQLGEISVVGQLQPSQIEPRFGGVPDPSLAPGQTRLDAWNFVSLERIGLQINRPILPLYLLAAPDPSLSVTPLRSLPEVDLSDGPHFGYAVQWFLFTAVLLVGYPFYVRSQIRSHASRT